MPADACGAAGPLALPVTVMSRGQSSVDRARMAIRVVPAPAPAEPSTALRSKRLALTLSVAAQVSEQTRHADLRVVSPVVVWEL